MYKAGLYFHFIGIGGSGMSGLAEILLASGFQVSGSDIKKSAVCSRLMAQGARIVFAHSAESIPGEASLVVYSSAITSDNPEMLEAKRRQLPLVRRAEVLAELMRLKYGVGVAGSHGKTTTTSITSAVLEAGALDPTVIIGGQLQHLDTGARLGSGKYLVAETDESDRSFLLMKPTVAVVTNIDDEHMNAYSSRSDLEDSFRQFIESVPFYGLAILCIDDPVLRKFLGEISRRTMSYGFSEDADLRAIDIVASPGGMEFSVLLLGEDLGRFFLPMLGRHLVQNALAAIAVGLEFGVPIDAVRGSLCSFGGVKRRLEVVGTAQGVTVMSDYGHHPTEIQASLRALKECFVNPQRRITAVFQPHRYSRTESCWKELQEAFKDCDRLIITEIYGANEESIDGITGENLTTAVSHYDKTFVPSLAGVWESLERELVEGDVIVCLGAGSIGGLPAMLMEKLADHESWKASSNELVGQYANGVG